ncbi:hypothetical protein [Streptomyces fagopyri]
MTENLNVFNSEMDVARRASRPAQFSRAQPDTLLRREAPGRPVRWSLVL